MRRIQLTQDIRPLSEFRAHVASFIEQVHKTNRPLVITNHGKSTAVLLNVQVYESIVDRLELMEDIRKAKDDIDHGRVVDHETAMKQVLKKIRK